MKTNSNPQRWTTFFHTLFIIFCETCSSSQALVSPFDGNVGGLVRVDGFRRRATNSDARSSSSSSSVESASSLVDELLALVKKSKEAKKGSKSSSEEDKAEIKAAVVDVVEQLEAIGAETEYLDDAEFVGSDDDDEDENDVSNNRKLLWDSYELAYFDGSIDGGRSDAEQRRRRPRRPIPTAAASMLRLLLRPFFGLRYSFQHVVRPNRVVNDVGVRLFGLPVSIVAGGDFARLSLEEVETLGNETTGVSLKQDTTIRIDFEEPVLWFGHRALPVAIGMGSKARSPPVTLCTTYVDDRVRTARARKGGRLVFTRGGRTKEAYANDWRSVDVAKPFLSLDGRIVLTTVAAISLRFLPKFRAPIGALAMLTTLFVAISRIIGNDGRGRKR